MIRALRPHRSAARPTRPSPAPRRSSSAPLAAPAVLAALGLLALLASASVAGAQAMARSFEVRNVDSRVVETWIWDLCEAHADEDCQVLAVSPGNPAQLTVRGTPAIIARVARLLAERDGFVDPTQTFQLILVEASRDGGMDSSLPQHAIAALRDVGEFLPFESFRRIDTALLSTTRSGETALAGPNDARYEVRLSFERVHAVDRTTILIDRLVIETDPVWRRPPGESEVGEGQAGWVSQQVIDTTLSLEVGETAVVGTSKLNGGDQALILLVTALEE